MFVHDTWHYQKRNLSYLKVIYLLWCRSSSPPPPHSAKSVYALKMLDVVILKLVGFFFCFLYMWQVLRSQKNAPNPFACFTNGKMMFSVLFYFVLNSEDDEG